MSSDGKTRAGSEQDLTEGIECGKSHLINEEAHLGETQTTYTQNGIHDRAQDQNEQATHSERANEIISPDLIKEELSNNIDKSNSSENSPVREEDSGDFDNTDGPGSPENTCRASIGESDRESLLDRVDLFESDTKVEQELKDIEHNFENSDVDDINGNVPVVSPVDIEQPLLHNGSEKYEEKGHVPPLDLTDLENTGSSVDGINDKCVIQYNTGEPALGENHQSSIEDVVIESNSLVLESELQDTGEDKIQASLQTESENNCDDLKTPLTEISNTHTNVTSDDTYVLEDKFLASNEDSANMPEKQEEVLSSSVDGAREDGVLSPALQRANFRYRWAKTVRTDAPTVVFFSSYKMEEPVKLTWSDASECYYSQDYDIPTGIYRGNLVVDGHTYPVEDLTVKHYTFEADLYVKEDLLEDEINKEPLTDKAIPEEFQGSSVDPPERTSVKLEDSLEMADVDIGIHKSNKYEELVKKQMLQSNSMESCANRSNLEKSDLHSSGRRTPIGDIAKESYQDGGDSYAIGDRPQSRGSLGDRPLSRGSLNNSVVEDEVEKPSSVQSGRLSSQRSGRQTPGSVGRITPQTTNIIDEFFQNDNSEQIRSSHSSVRQTPENFDDRRTPIRSREPSLNGSVYSTSGDVKISSTDLRSPLHNSGQNSARQTPASVKDALDDVLENDVTKSPARSVDGSIHSTSRLTPRANFVDDVLGQSTPLVKSDHGSAPITPRQLSIHSSPRPSSQLITDTLRSSQEKLYNSGGSRPQSLTSEQELTQYFENGSRHGSVHSSTPASVHGTDRGEPRRTPSIPSSPAINPSERTSSAASLPVITTQQRIQAEKRSMTPDNHIRVPGEVTPIVRGLTPRSNMSSRASDRTITPTSAAGLSENGVKEDFQSQRILDLEDSVRNLRKLLSSRETEVHELTEEVKHLKDLNKSLTEELDRNKEQPQSRGLVVELERKYTAVLKEKEILASEVVKLRDEVEELQHGRPGEPEGDLSDSPSGISSYNPNNPYALQRRISDLQSQVQDLQEANEAAVSELTAAERQIEELKRENGDLRHGQHSSSHSLQAENKKLHDQISRLYEQGYGASHVLREDENRQRIESQQLKDDNRALKERNYKLHEENLKLKEEVARITDKSRSKSPVADGRLSQSSLYAENRNYSLSSNSEGRGHHSEGRVPQPVGRANHYATYTEGMMSQNRTPNSDYSGDRPGVSDRHHLSKTYTSPLKSSFDKDEVRRSNSLRKPTDQYHLAEKSISDQKFRSSLDRYRNSRTGETDDKYRHSAERNEGQFRQNLSREDSGIKLRSMDQAEIRIRTALEKADAHLRNVEKEDSKYNYEPNMREKLMDDSRYRYDDKLVSLSKDLDSKPVDTRSYDRKVLDSDKSRSELYIRTMPDGGVSDKDLYSSSNHYESRTPDHMLNYNTMGLESERVRYDKERRAPLSTEREQKTQTNSYEWSRSKGMKERVKEWSRSEADLRYTPSRGRSRTPERFFSGRRRSVSPEYDAPTRRHYRKPQRSLTAKWDDDVSMRHTISGNRELGDPDVRPAYSKTAPSLSIYRTKDSYKDFDKGYDTYRQPAQSGYHDDPGDVSDTATDILVNAEPFEKQAPSPPLPNNRLHRRHGSQRMTSQLRYRQRRDSLDSSGSMSDVEDIDDQLYGKHSRSKSADGRELIRRSQPLGTERSSMNSMTQGERTLFKTMPSPASSNLRTVTPAVLTTQHNRNNLTSSTGSLTSLTTGMKPFAPRSPADVSIEDVVKFSRQGGKLSQGRVKFVGHLPGRGDAYLGVELDKEDGKHDGKFEGMRYFRCKPNKGVFVAFNKVVMAWAP